MVVADWISKNYIEVFGAVTGILYVFLEIRQNIWLWPVGIVTSAVYIWVFFTSKIYADMSLQGYYLIISLFGWYWWVKGRTASSEALAKEEGSVDKESSGNRAQGTGEEIKTGSGKSAEIMVGGLKVTRLKLKIGVILCIVFIMLFFFMWLVLTRLTDSPVPIRDSFVTSLSVIATWMLARKIYEHWYLWIIVNFVSVVLFLVRGLYPTVLLYVVYGVMSFAGLIEWRKTIPGKK